MISFAVWHAGLAEGASAWVLAIDVDKFLLCDLQGTFYWQEMSACRFVRASTPDVPLLVADISSIQQKQANIVVPRNGF